MLLVTSVSYSFMLNGEPFGFLLPERGIRQGDPLFPYLFIFCGEALSLMMQRAEDAGKLTGVAVAPEASRISHLLFADDTMVFCEANEVQLEEIRSILHRYEKALGQVINFQKSSMSVGGRISPHRKVQLAAILGVKLVPCHDHYLGLPASSGRARGTLFRGIRDRLWGRVTGWNSKLLSQAGRGVLIKSVLQSLPTSLKEFNLALLAKQGWRLLTRPEDLLSRVLKARYVGTGSFWDATVGRRPSLTWRSLIKARPLLAEGCFWCTGLDAQEARWRWRFNRKGYFTVRSAYNQAIIMRDREVPSSSISNPALMSQRGLLWRTIWNTRVSLRVRVFMWRMCMDVLPTLDKLERRKAGINTLCGICGMQGESVKHVFLECQFARQFWALACFPWRIISVWNENAVEWVSQIVQNVAEEDKCRFFTFCWMVWRNRCKKVMEDKMLDPMSVLRNAEIHCYNYNRVRSRTRVDGN
ncbi:UNVERIFIED_CONTAM: hypothetical protein Sradi_2034600 [Sesamum radiatum]|uniref:Reverse transcriptase domain-containing protein n=1 Tax=Sesamum radiatum TaxID=300843 RepID=A0AAW2TIC6_SESRA